MVNTSLFELGAEPYVLPSQYEQVFYSKVPGKVGWSFVVRHDPRGRQVKYNLDKGNEDGTLEEEYDDEEKINMIGQMIKTIQQKMTKNQLNQMM